MFKRANKITSLLLTAAAVVSIVPINVNAAVSDSIKSEKGEIYNAVAYKDGKYYISGEPSKKDDAAYYLSNGQYLKLDNINSEDKAKVYGSKYVEVEDGDYYIDLSNGKVSDDKIKENELDTASVNLRSKIKSDNEGRYDDTDAKSVKDLTELPKAKFADSWYLTEYQVKAPDAAINGGAATFNVYADKTGKYIDADYNLGKIKVKLSNGQTANIQNTNDEDNHVRGQVTDVKVIGQDSNNIYRLAKLTVKSSDSGVTINEVNGIEVSTDATAFSTSDSGATVSFDVIQIISKSQASGDVDGIKYSKTVSNYMISDKDGKKTDLFGSDENNFTVADGKLINYEIDGDSIDAEVINLKNKSSIYYIEIGDYDHVKLQDGENSVDIDTEGNLWALSGDNIYKFNNDQDFEKIYSADDEYTNLSVYDKDNLVVWNSDNEIYSIIGNKPDTNDTSGSTTGGDSNTNTNTDNNGNTTTPSNAGQIKAGWSLANGSWSYNNDDGTKFKGWLNNSGAWYYLDTNGSMSTGWKNINNQWYFLDISGVMKTGWLNDNGTWYYLNSSGEMLSNTTINGYKLGANGAWVK